MCIQKVSYRIGFFIDNDYKSAAKLQRLDEIFLRRWEKNENNLLFFVPNADLPGILQTDARRRLQFFPLQQWCLAHRECEA